MRGLFCRALEACSPWFSIDLSVLCKAFRLLAFDFSLVLNV